MSNLATHPTDRFSRPGATPARSRRLRVAALTVMLATLSLVFGALAGLDPVPLTVLSVTYLLKRASRPSFWEVRPLAAVRLLATDRAERALALPEA